MFMASLLKSADSSQYVVRRFTWALRATFSGAERNFQRECKTCEVLEIHSSYELMNSHFGVVRGEEGHPVGTQLASDRLG